MRGRYSFFFSSTNLGYTPIAGLIQSILFKNREFLIRIILFEIQIIPLVNRINLFEIRNKKIGKMLPILTEIKRKNHRRERERNNFFAGIEIYHY